MNHEISYPIIVLSLPEEDGGGYTALAPDLYGCRGSGDTPEAAVADAIAAAKEWIDETKRLGRRVPQPGSAAELHRQRAEAIEALVEKQQTLIEEQQRRIDTNGRDIERLTEQLEALREQLRQIDNAAGETLAWTAAIPSFPPRSATPARLKARH